MLYLLDTNHITVLDRGGDDATRLSERLDQLESSCIAVSIVTYEEQMRGWLAHIHGAKSVDRQAAGYQRLEQMLEFYCDMSLLPFSGTVLDTFQHLWTERIRITTMDLKIAATALAYDATLLTANTKDFVKVPNLRIEDWTLSK